MSIWREDDPVLLTAAAYKDIAAVLSSQAENNGNQPVTGQIRRRLVSFIPAPTKSAPSVQELDWISGELRSARAAPAAASVVEEVSAEEGGGAPGEGLAISPIRVNEKKVNFSQPNSIKIIKFFVSIIIKKSKLKITEKKRKL